MVNADEVETNFRIFIDYVIIDQIAKRLTTCYIFVK